MSDKKLNSEVVRKMLVEYHGFYTQKCANHSIEVRKMTAAATVLLNRMKIDPTDEEVKVVWYAQGMLTKDEIRKVIKAFQKARRNSILKPEPPSMEQEIANEIADSLGITSPDITERIMALSRHSEVKK